MDMKDLTCEEKARCFDKLCDRYYNRNFGRMTKSDLDLLMFHFYMENLKKAAKSGEKVKDTDYAISKQLGISQQKIRNLKVKHQLIYPDENWDWKHEFAELIKNATIDDKHFVSVNVRDPNLFIELKNQVEENGSFVDTQLNQSILKIPADQFLELAISVDENDSTRKKITNELKKQFSTNNKSNSVFDEKHPVRSVIKVTGDLVSIISDITSMFSPENVIANSLLSLIKGKISTAN